LVFFSPITASFSFTGQPFLYPCSRYSPPNSIKLKNKTKKGKRKKIRDQFNFGSKKRARERERERERGGCNGKGILSRIRGCRWWLLQMQVLRHPSSSRRSSPLQGNSLSVPFTLNEHI